MTTGFDRIGAYVTCQLPPHGDPRPAHEGPRDPSCLQAPTETREQRRLASYVGFVRRPGPPYRRRRGQDTLSGRVPVR